MILGARAKDVPKYGQEKRVAFPHLPTPLTRGGPGLLPGVAEPLAQRLVWEGRWDNLEEGEGVRIELERGVGVLLFSGRAAAAVEGANKIPMFSGRRCNRFFARDEKTYNATLPLQNRS